jgi:hypothetical protein
MPQEFDVGTQASSELKKRTAAKLGRLDTRSGLSSTAELTKWSARTDIGAASAPRTNTITITLRSARSTPCDTRRWLHIRGLRYKRPERMHHQQIAQGECRCTHGWLGATVYMERLAATALGHTLLEASIPKDQLADSLKSTLVVDFSDTDRRSRLEALVEAVTSEFALNARRLRSIQLHFQQQMQIGLSTSSSSTSGPELKMIPTFVDRLPAGNETVRV